MSYHEIVESLAKGRFGASEVTRVAVSGYDDWTGEECLDIVVVWDDSVTRFDVEKAANFKRDIRAELDKQHGSPFPVVTFIARSEDAEAA